MCVRVCMLRIVLGTTGFLWLILFIYCLVFLAWLLAFCSLRRCRNVLVRGQKPVEVQSIFTAEEEGSYQVPGDQSVVRGVEEGRVKKCNIFKKNGWRCSVHITPHLPPPPTPKIRNTLPRCLSSPPPPPSSTLSHRCCLNIFPPAATLFFIRFSFSPFSSSLDSTHTLVLLLNVYLTPSAATGLRKYADTGGNPVLPGRKRDSGAVKRKIYACLFTATAWRSPGTSALRYFPPLHPSPPGLAVGNTSCLTNQPLSMQKLML